ncbi:TerC family protein [Flagellimonas sp. S174]|uniref:TerC family protein n=1 Tax=Flagellimonas sp. S174 TaxID=3410790 RepID=UPI003BF53221
MFEILSSPDAWVALFTLTFLEIILGIDNIVFISILANRLPIEQRKKATNLGLIAAMVQRVALLFLVSFLIGLSKPFYEVELSWIKAGLSWQSIILFTGGLFLLFKSTSEIHDKVSKNSNIDQEEKAPVTKTLQKVILQILLVDFVFSIDSILTAVGMTNGLGREPMDALIIMIIAVVISIGVMLIFANAIRVFIDNNPSIQMLALSFLILIGFMLITEAAHLSHVSVFGQSIGAIPKGYLYFAIAFSLLVEFLNIKFRKKIQLIDKDNL